ncbi:MAG: B12-binding domain-containing radical SAM protein [Nitrospirae bacterium]|nr:B12-binding domain-containing radical SAM protein [Nitrospirota bacterium]
MKILLIMPSGAMHRHKTGNFKRFLRYAPLTLTTLAALVPEDIDAEIEIVDEGVEVLNDDFQADLVGINAITGTSKRAYAIADKARRRGMKVVLGGVHPTLMPQESAQHADAVVMGFAEETWPQLIYDFKNGRLQKYYKQPENASLKNLPFPRRDLLKKNAYITINSTYATRSCPNSCRFCVIPIVWGKRAYFRPIKEVIKEIDNMEGRTLVLIDPNLIADVEYAKELFTELAPLKKKWFGLSTMQVTSDEELFKLIVKSGCKGLFLGFESIAQATLKDVMKDFNLVKKYKQVVEKLHDNGIAIQGAFVFGFDQDDRMVFKRTVDFVNELKIDLPRFSVLTPFPGTPIYDSLKSQGRIVEKDWSLYDGQHVVFQPAKMTAEELQDGLYWAWKNSYGLSSIFKRISGTGSSFLVSIVTNLGYKLYADKIAKY